MELLHHTITLPTNTQTVTVIPFGCVHADDEGFDEDLFVECLDTIRATPLCYGIGLGDYHSFARTHYRSFVKSYRDDEDSEKQIDRFVKRDVVDFYEKYLKRIPKGKLLGLAEGNHGWTYASGVSTTQQLCELAGVPYLAKGSLHRLAFQHRSGHPIAVLRMLVHHGDWSGGAMTFGGDANSLMGRGQPWDVDIAIAGHTHRKWAYIDPVMTIPLSGKLRINERPKAYIRAGCFTKGYIPGCITYGERKLMKPTSLGYVTLKIRFLQRVDHEKIKALRKQGVSSAAARRVLPVTYQFNVEF